jgi:seryl-tRNA synthetase
VRYREGWLMRLTEAQQMRQDIYNLEKDVARLKDAVAACQAQIDEAKTDKLVKSAKRGKAEHTKELKAAKAALAEAKKAFAALDDADREYAETTPVVPQESVEAHAGLAAADGGAQ